MFAGVKDSSQIVLNGLQDTIEGSYNLQLIIPSQGNVEFNPETGNYEKVNTQQIIYQARVRIDNFKREKDVIGVDYNRFPIKGYLVSPLNFTAEIPTKIPSLILNDGSWISGFFYKQLSLENELKENYNLRQLLGDKITGFFEVASNVNN